MYKLQILYAAIYFYTSNDGTVIMDSPNVQNFPKTSEDGHMVAIIISRKPHYDLLFNSLGPWKVYPGFG